MLADLRPLTQTPPASSSSSADTSALDAETLRYALKAWLWEEGFYDVKVRVCVCVRKRKQWSGRLAWIAMGGWVGRWGWDFKSTTGEPGLLPWSHHPNTIIK